MHWSRACRPSAAAKTGPDEAVGFGAAVPDQACKPGALPVQALPPAASKGGGGALLAAFRELYAGLEASPASLGPVLRQRRVLQVRASCTSVDHPHHLRSSASVGMRTCLHLRAMAKSFGVYTARQASLCCA